MHLRIKESNAHEGGNLVKILLRIWREAKCFFRIRGVMNLNDGNIGPRQEWYLLLWWRGQLPRSYQMLKSCALPIRFGGGEISLSFCKGNRGFGLVHWNLPCSQRPEEMCIIAGTSRLLPAGCRIFNKGLVMGPPKLWRSVEPHFSSCTRKKKDLLETKKRTKSSL